MYVKELKEWVIKNKIEERTLIGFWKNIKEYRYDSPQEFIDNFTNYNEEKLTVQIESVSLKLGNWPKCDYNCIISTIPIIYNGKEIGYYDLLFNLDGEIFDDYFVIY